MALAKAKMLRGDLEQLVIGKEVQRLLQAWSRGRRQPHRDIGSRRPDVGLLLLPADIDADVPRALLDADDHPLIDGFARLDEGGAAFLRAGQPESKGRSCGRSGEGAVAL